MTIAAYDFCKPGRLAGNRENRLSGWLRLACALATRTWARHLPFKAEWTFHAPDTKRGQEALSRLTETAVAHRLALAGGKVISLLAMPRRLVLAVTSGLVGDIGTALPEDRELTPIEESLFEYFVNSHLLPSLNETWPGAEPVNLELRGTEPNPRWTRLFPADTPLVTCTFLLSGPFGVEEWFWFMPREGLLVLLDQPASMPVDEADAAAVKQRLEARVQDLPVPITVSLGSVEVRLSQLSALRVGDLIVLDQRVSEPLTARMAEENKYRVWPGRIGSRQAFKIESHMNR